jgi:hypothetical protein
MLNYFVFFIFLLLCFDIEAKSIKTILEKEKISKKQLNEIKNILKSYPKENVPILFEVMKNQKMSEQSRWLATMLVGKTLGKRSIDYLSKYAVHPEVILRLASLKSLLSLEAKDQSMVFKNALFDKSLLVRKQALEAVRKLRIDDAGPELIKMLVDRKNYFMKNKRLKRSPIIKNIIITIGALKIKKTKRLLVSMRKKAAYEDLFPSLDLAISRL